METEMKIQINMKPLSVNDAWKGRRFKTDAYKSYEQSVLFLLPKIKRFPKPPYLVAIDLSVSTHNADIDNPVKPILDILQKKYGFNDRDVVQLHVRKYLVFKGQESFQVRIENIPLILK